MAEFDTSVKIKDMRSFEVTTSEDFDQFAHRVWGVLAGADREVGDGGGGEFWADFSSFLQTRYVVCNILDMQDGNEEGVAARNRFLVRLRAGSKAGRGADVVLALLALGAAWFLSRAFVPSPAAVDICMLAVCVVALVVLGVFCGKPFGKEETAMIQREIQQSI